MNAAAVSIVPLPKEDTTLAGLVERLEVRDSEANPDRTVSLNKVRMTTDGTITIPGAYGTYALTDWARGQLSRTVGLNFERYFSNARPTDVAEEMNRRFSRATETVKLRSVSRVSESTEATGTITALVSPDYSPVPDAVIGNVLRDALASVNHDTKILRSTTTDLTTAYVVRVGERLTPNAEVGAVEGCLVVRNSGVGYAKLLVQLMLHRLACKNGLIVSLPGATLVRAVHRGIDLGKVRERLSERLRGLPERINTSARLLAESTKIEVANVELEVRDLLRESRLPLRLVPVIMASLLREPGNSRFAVVQAVTHAAQSQDPEVRWAMERAAGLLLTA